MAAATTVTAIFGVLVSVDVPLSFALTVSKDEHTGGNFVRGQLCGELRERDCGDADRHTNDELYLHRLEWGRVCGHRRLVTATFDLPVPFALTVTRAGEAVGR